MTSIKSEGGTIAAASGDIKRIVREYYELFAHKFDTLGEMDQLLKRYNLLKLT